MGPIYLWPREVRTLLEEAHSFAALMALDPSDMSRRHGVHIGKDVKTFSASDCASLAWLMGKMGLPIRRNLDEPVDLEATKRHLEQMRQLAEGADAAAALLEVTRALRTLDLKGERFSELECAGHYESIRRHLSHDLARLAFVKLPREAAARALAWRSFGGGRVVEVFPELGDEIFAALWCAAVAMPIACVFHLMRIVEVGLRRIVAALNVPVRDRPMWEDYIRAIEARLKYETVGDRLPREQEQFYAHAGALVRLIARAWRNPLVHEIAESYSESEGANILGYIEDFMAEVAANLPAAPTNGQAPA